MHEIDKIHQADLGVDDAATARCRSYVARRYPRSGNSCRVDGDTYGQGVLLNGYNSTERKREKEREWLGARRGRVFLYMNLAGSLKEHISWLFVTFCIFCT